jgi:phosphate transport system permease protein
MILSSNNTSSHFHSDQFLLWSLRFLALVAGSLLLLVVLFLVHEAWPAFQHLGLASFFTDAAWYPTDDLYLFTPMLWGTLLATLGSIMLAAPIGIVSALFIQYYAPPFLATGYRRFIELLSGMSYLDCGGWLSSFPSSPAGNRLVQVY